MMNEGMGTASISHYVALATCVVLTAAGQICLRRGAAGKSTFLLVYLAPATILGYALFGLNTVAAVYAMQAIDLKTGSTWSALAVPLVVVAAKFLLGETIGRSKALGCGLVFLGIAVFHSA